ncbi:hypothetical protein NQZ68_028228 [Dissostichus eleginoides]|nr:hypothetical protein NQZ68_028228 [Dissostichus eleginoides]
MAAAFASMHGLGGVQPGGFANNEKKGRGTTMQLPPWLITPLLAERNSSLKYIQSSKSSGAAVCSTPRDLFTRAKRLCSLLLAAVVSSLLATVVSG